MQENPEFKEKKELKESDFKAPEELETGYTEKSGEKPEKTMEETKEEARTEPGERTSEETGETKEEKRTVYKMEKRLTKSKSDRMLFGVCSGIGKYLRIDPTLVRLAFVLLALIDGIGIVIYIILAIIMPSEESVQMVPETRESS